MFIYYYLTAASDKWKENVMFKKALTQLQLMSENNGIQLDFGIRVRTYKVALLAEYNLQIEHTEIRKIH
ncbi:hypothetical protein NQ318_020316 [Aromia moschata]|uniref:Uncharacterized protein n=1 Tax=Aromia moschata TaxID=1265417 RepID=A0AAV8X3N7_9CUCU|nr:hypothetical protein NQ318_020316 [Aromia moschata]